MAKVRRKVFPRSIMPAITSSQAACEEQVGKYVASLIRRADDPNPVQQTRETVKATVTGIREAHASTQIRILAGGSGIASLGRTAKRLRRYGKLCPWWTVDHQRVVNGRTILTGRAGGGK